MPPEYTLNGKGPGQWVGEDYPRWNILYLTYPVELEMLRTGKWTLDELYTHVTPQDMGRVQSVAAPELEDVLPGLRSLLGKPITLFVHQFMQTDFRITTPTHLFDGKWPDVVLANAKRIWNEKADKDDQIVEIDPAVSNVLHVKFGKKLPTSN